MNKKGKFITLEGMEGAGKSSLAKGLSEKLSERGTRNLLTREPGDGPIGAQIRQILLHGEHLDAWTETFLFLADRRQHVINVIKPALEEGVWVICDRFADSTIVYQGYARGLPIEKLRELNAMVIGDCIPDLTFLLDVSPEVGISRVQNKDRLDCEPMEFHVRVREGFLSEAKREESRWTIINSEMSEMEVLENSWGKMTNLLEIYEHDTPARI
jgi:dTMP kinase